MARRPRTTREQADYEAESALLRAARRIRRWLALAASASVVGAVVLGIALLYLRSQALPVSTVQQNSEIYDLHGDLIRSYSAGQNRQVVPLKELAPTLVQATLAIEDQRFYDHFGIDPRGLARAVWTDLKTLSLDQGASTITQQLARNLYLNHDRTWDRKLKEAVYAVQLELQLSKEQILEQYLNQIYYGFSTYGAQAASELYFGKPAKELSLAESAMLAGIPKGPKYFSPFLNPENAKARQKLILNAMAEQGFITKQQADEAARQELHYKDQQAAPPSEAPYFQDYVRQFVTEELGISESLFDGGGIRIYTTLDKRAQKNAEEALAKHLGKDTELQGALVSLDPRTGYVKALVGGRDYEKNQFNRVFATTRQPGSSFKPIVYLTALQNRFTPLTKYKSEPTEFPYDNGKKVYKPSNFNNHFANDYIDMRQALAKSDNIYAVHTLLDVGPDKVIETARRMGITSPLSPLPSLALGTFPVSPMEMASAFAILANQGVRVEPTAVLKVTNAKGKVLYEAKPKQERVAEASYTYVLTNLMESVFEEGGTGSRVSDLLKRPVAGKTGSTDTDAWMVGYTPELSTAVWVGYDKGRIVSSLDSYQAAPIFAEYMEKTLDPVPPKLFPVPQGVVSVYIDPVTGKLANDACPNSRLEAFISGTEPTTYCAETTTVGQPKPDASGGTRSWWDDLKRWWNE
ncbi:penicillin-binding protein 2D [Paenibacillus sp. J31TS4]|uniref:transglycosylase domain-containing protein n=1 Tax=Paenibacillus sp. J31TS4 TaxID=2807195 RepID=UPI001B1E548B|nr:PBP1A family penicillin-binding protein [Paenibacillus sp. J31TS4]GIP40310.1 penicillin-binding protein 2D [Paenibacillus sp. J31TS4]